MSRYIRLTMLMVALILLSGGTGVLAQGSGPAMTYDQALACVKQVLPAEKYMTNDYLPTADALAKIDTPSTTKKIKVGMPWILDDEEAQLYDAIELGYFKDEGLDVELVSGGPGKDHIQTLGAGSVDIAFAAGGSSIPSAVVSPTPIDLVAVGTLLKDMPYALITIRPDLLNKKITPQDVAGKTIGVQQGGEVYINMLLDKYNIPHDKVTLIDAGFTPDVLLVGKADFYTGWIMNQPRLVEQGLASQGKDPKGWNALLYRDYVYSEPSDVIAVRRETLNSPDGQDMVKRFLRAVYRGTQYLLAEPDKSAAITEKYTNQYKDQPVPAADALWRFKQQETLINGTDKLGLLAMSPDQWNQTVALLLEYGQIKLTCK